RQKGGLLLLIRGLFTLRILRSLPLLPRIGLFSEFPLRKRVSPASKPALRELHDIALVNEREALAFVRQGVLDGRSDQPFGTLAGDRFDADCAGAREPNLLE